MHAGSKKNTIMGDRDELVILQMFLAEERFVIIQQLIKE